ncbi:M12 family metallopeptidase [Pontibacter rufus]|uniref:M12 family metallopeptidase n=1 Tax=Pontibacter rufus TaxID=2791028 RepID=UPI001E60AE8C|nr:M12 family metallopeptidase [Pontibacter sp. 172403-2]
MKEQQENIPMRELPVQKPNEAKKAQDRSIGRYFCALHERPARVFAPGVTSGRQSLINLLSNKWVSGTVLHYYFFDRDTDGQNVQFTDGTTEWFSWVGAEAQKEVVRAASKIWESVGIGIEFREVFDREDAEIRIGFMQGDGAWSWLGREILEHGPNIRTMNFGWDLTQRGEIDTAIHEIGHTLGFPHEHQNPKAGIIWDEEAVYEALAQPPNNWDRDTTFWNIIRKLPSNEVEGTTWDPNSIMHYPFEKGLIKKPDEYAINGLRPAGGLSAKDKSWVKTLYPTVHKTHNAVKEQLMPSQSVLLKLSAGDQRNFTVLPQETRFYNFQTFGTSDSIMVLFEDENGELRYRTGDDDSGQDTNAFFKIKLIKGHKYLLRIRMYFNDRPQETAVMMW